MNNTNRLISSDNKGYAAIRMERDFNGGPGAFPGKGPFVAAFSTANQGDVSPNTKGAFCNEGPNAGQPCDKLTSTCPNDRGINLVQLCTAQGPAGKNDRENTRIIGENQYRKAVELFANATQPLGGRLHYRQSFVNMTHLVVEVNGYNYTTCKPAMGYSFAGGTTDGPGFFNFHQGDSDPEHPFWDRIRDFLVEPSESERQCQLPKPILLPTGEAVLPHAWQPDIVDIQLVVLGDLVIIAVPGEFSTMAGRRLRDHVRQILTDGGVISANAIVTIAGLSNTYTNYIVTYEEYLIQRYEGASTIYGPHTLSAYLQEYGKLARAIVDNVTVPAGPSPPDFYDRLISQAPVPREDTQPDGAAFGAVKRGACRVCRTAVGISIALTPFAQVSWRLARFSADVASQYTIGESVSVLFYGANPRNNLGLESTFLTVEYNNGTTWVPVRYDGDFDTELRWVPHHEPNAPQFVSDVEIVWITDSDAQRTLAAKGCVRLLRCKLMNASWLFMLGGALFCSGPVPHRVQWLPARRQRERLPVHWCLGYLQPRGVSVTSYFLPMGPSCCVEPKFVEKKKAVQNYRTRLPILERVAHAGRKTPKFKAHHKKVFLAGQGFVNKGLARAAASVVQLLVQPERERTAAQPLTRRTRPMCC